MKKRVGILTFFKSINNGAFLQAYSLWSLLSERYADRAVVELINYDSKLAVNHYTARNENSKNRENYHKFRECLDLLSLSEGELVSDDLHEIEGYIKSLDYDVIIVGSDEVWKTDGMRGFPNAYWLNFDFGKTTRVAYAVSGRNDYQSLNTSQKAYMKEALERFDYIGVRDKVTENELKCMSAKAIYQNCDPTILLADRFRFDNCEIQARRKLRGLSINKKTILIILYDYQLMKRLYRMLGGEYNIIATYDIVGDASDQDYYAQTPFEWQELIGISDIVITSLFHGTIFSMIHNKRFLSIETAVQGRGKIEDLLIRCGLKDHLVYKDHFRNRGDCALGMEIFTRTRMMMNDNDSISYNSILETESDRANSFLDKMDEYI